MNDSDLFRGFFMGAIVMLALMMFYPMPCVKKQGQQNAIDHGAASWVVDQKTGKTKFTWKDEIKQ
jgi:hypothetical protein